MSKGQRIGYVWVSSYDQNDGRQRELIEEADRIFTDKASGKDTHRPELQAILTYAREGDTVVVHSMDRLARNLDDLRQIVNGLTRCLQIISVTLPCYNCGGEQPWIVLHKSVTASCFS